MQTYDQVFEQLISMADPEAAAGMSRVGITPDTMLGIFVPDLQALAKEIGTDHDLAQQLWASGVREARILACFVDDPHLVGETQMDDWAADFNSWDVCDLCCTHLFRKTRLAHAKALEWSARDAEFTKRAGFVLMVCLTVHDKKATDEPFERFLSIIRREAIDDRNLVKKAVNWALRQIGKRNPALNRQAIATAREIETLDSRSARWVASHALRELTGEAVQRRLAQK